jgi:hypothetical protein
MNAWTFKIRNAGTAGDPSDAAEADFTTESAPAAGMYAVGFSSGAIVKFDLGAMPVSSLGGLVAAAQTFSDVDDTNVTLTITSTTDDHEFALGWTGQLAVTRGGTGLSTVTTGDLLYGSAADTLSALTIGVTAGHVLTVSGGGLPEWAAPTGVTDHTGLSNLGWDDSDHTGAIDKVAAFGASGEAVEQSVSQLLSRLGPGSAATGDMIYFDGSDWRFVSVGSNGDVLTLVSGVPAWVAP